MILHLVVRDQFGEPVPSVSIAITARGLSLRTATTGAGTVSLKLPARPAVKFRFSAPTYRTLTVRLR